MAFSPDIDARRFEADPFGYSALAWHKWGVVCASNGFYVDISKPPTPHDLKNPILWLCHANALSEAASRLVKEAPEFGSMPTDLRTICHSQYHAVALMLVGYSLEVCLKAMLLIKLGVDEFLIREREHFHHDLGELSSFVPELNDKDKAILKSLSHFVRWAGRYPDPGSKRMDSAIDVFELSEKHQITAGDLFRLAARIMGHVREVAK